MAFFNYVTKEITLKVVYYGPGLSGKTTNLQHLYSVLDPSSRGKFISLATEADRTLFFDFLPVDLGKIKDFTLRFQLYTVPGQIRYNATRKLVLKGADAVVFVADSQREMREQNIESFDNMRQNLVANGLNPDDIPVVMQYNKRDLPSVLSVEELNSDLNKRDYQYLEASAVNGTGVQETFKTVTKTLLKDISRKHHVDIMPVKEEGITIRVPEREAFPAEETAALSTAAATAEEPSAVPLPDDGRFGEIAGGIAEVTAAIGKAKDTLSFLASEVGELKKQQADLAKMIKELSTTLAKAREKRRWFHLSR